MPKKQLLTVDFSKQLETRIEECEKAFIWQVDLHPKVFHVGERSDEVRDLSFRTCIYEWRLFDFPKGITRGRAASVIRRSSRNNPWSPADPSQMLAFATQHFEGFKKYHVPNEWAHYFVGLGGDFQTVLGAQFEGINFGMSYFLTQVSQKKWIHAGGPKNRFLAVRLIEAK